MRYQHGGFNMPALNDILTLIEKVADGYMLAVFKASVVNFPNQTFEDRVKDPTVIAELKPVLDAYS